MTDPTIHLYFIAACSVDGDNLDLFVRAADPDTALSLLLQYYGLGRGDAQNVKVFLVPTANGPVGALSWHETVQEQLPLGSSRTMAPPQTTASMFSDRERDTVLAALRVYQRYLDYERGEDPDFDQYIDRIASDHGCALGSGEIDVLCERINTEDI